MKEQKRCLFKGVVQLTNSKETGIASKRVLFARTESVLKSLAGSWAGNRDFKIEVLQII